MKLSGAFTEALQKLDGNWEYNLTASKAWILTYYADGPPPVAVSHLQGKKGEAFYEELVKLSDVKEFWDARAVLIASRNALDTDRIQLATNAGIYAVLDGSVSVLESALKGADVSEVNRGTQLFLLSKKSRAASKECRDLALQLLSKKWMTLRELEEQLQWRFDARTVWAQVRSLQRRGAIRVRGRTNRGDGLLGTAGGRYRMRPDLSVPTLRALLSEEIVHMIMESSRPLGYREISENLGVKPHVATAVLRSLSRAGLVQNEGHGWKCGRNTK